MICQSEVSFSRAHDRRTRQQGFLPLLAMLALVGCSPDESPPPAPPRPVVVFEVAAPSATIDRSFSGATAAINSAEVAFEVSGRIESLTAVRGRRYEQGAVLAQLDVSTYQAELRSAQAEATRANEELRRIQQLFETDTASRAQFDSAIAAQRSAAANLDTAQKRVDDGTIRMPYPGVIGEVLKEEQEFASAGSPLLRIQGDGGMEMEVGVPGDLIGSIEVAMPCAVRIGSLPGVAINGVVTQISREVSRNTTYLVTLSLTPPAGIDLREGLDGEALQWAAGRLMARLESRKCLVMISDGAPMDTATSNYNEPFFLEKHLQEVVGNIERASAIELKAIGISLDMDDFFRESVNLDLSGTLGNSEMSALEILFSPSIPQLVS